jgi:hypothetical protein
MDYFFWSLCSLLPVPRRVSSSERCEFIIFLLVMTESVSSLPDLILPPNAHLNVLPLHPTHPDKLAPYLYLFYNCNSLVAHPRTHGFMHEPLQMTHWEAQRQSGLMKKKDLATVGGWTYKAPSPLGTYLSFSRPFTPSRAEWQELDFTFSFGCGLLAVQAPAGVGTCTRPHLLHHCTIHHACCGSRGK